MDDREDRLYPSRPLVGVGAVVLDGQRVLLVRRDQPPAKGIWSVPGGLVELGETAQAAIRREVCEECGVDIDVGPVLGLFQPVQRDEDGRIRYHYIVIDFVAYYRGGQLRSGDDAAEARWVLPAELETYDLLPATREMIDMALTCAEQA